LKELKGGKQILEYKTVRPNYASGSSFASLCLQKSMNDYSNKLMEGKMAASN